MEYALREVNLQNTVNYTDTNAKSSKLTFINFKNVPIFVQR